MLYLKTPRYFSVSSLFSDIFVFLLLEVLLDIWCTSTIVVWYMKKFHVAFSSFENVSLPSRRFFVGLLVSLDGWNEYEQCSCAFFSFYVGYPPIQPKSSIREAAVNRE